MNIKNMIAGLTILEQYYIRPDTYNLGAEHDIFYTYPTDIPLREEHVKKMIELGWFQDVHVEDFSEKDYTPNAGWRCYV